MLRGSTISVCVCLGDRCGLSVVDKVGSVLNKTHKQTSICRWSLSLLAAGLSLGVELEDDREQCVERKKLGLEGPDRCCIQG